MATIDIVLVQEWLSLLLLCPCSRSVKRDGKNAVKKKPRRRTSSVKNWCGDSSFVLTCAHSFPLRPALKTRHRYSGCRKFAPTAAGVSLYLALCHALLFELISFGNSFPLLSSAFGLRCFVNAAFGIAARLEWNKRCVFHCV